MGVGFRKPSKVPEACRSSRSAKLFRVELEYQMGRGWSGKVSRNSDWRTTQRGTERFRGGQGVSEETRVGGMRAEVSGSESGGCRIDGYDSGSPCW